jgi:hypothetical protein
LGVILIPVQEIKNLTGGNNLNHFTIPRDVYFGENALDVSKILEGKIVLHTKVARHEMVAKAVEDPCTSTNPRETSVEEMKKLYKAAFYGQDIAF